MAATPRLALHFARLGDPRRRSHRLHLPLDLVIVTVCAALCGADNWHALADFAEARFDWLRRFLPLPGGVPSHDTFERFYDRLDPVVFHRCFQSWANAFAATLGIDHIAIDGKSLRSSGAPGLRMLHVVNAFATQHRITLGQLACAEKSNEITAIPQLLELLELKGAVMTIDAMGCQTAIAQQIVDGDSDYVLPVKGNQPNLYTAIERALSQALESADKLGLDRNGTSTRSNYLPTTCVTSRSERITTC